MKDKAIHHVTKRSKVRIKRYVSNGVGDIPKILFYHGILPLRTVLGGLWLNPLPLSSWKEERSYHFLVVVKNRILSTLKMALI